MLINQARFEFRNGRSSVGPHAAVGGAGGRHLYAKGSTAFRQLPQSREFTRAACAVPPSQIVTCRVLYRESSNVATLTATALDEWQEAYVANDKSKVWDSRRRYAQLMFKFRELTKASWDENYMGNVWTAMRNGPVSALLVGYKGELDNALSVRNNFCVTLLGDLPPVKRIGTAMQTP